MQRYLGCGSDSAELSRADQTAAVCQSEHPVGADEHSWTNRWIIGDN